MKRKGQFNPLAAILGSPMILGILAIGIAVLLFGGLGLLNGVTSIFGIDIISGAVAGLARPIAMMLGLFIFYLFATTIIPAVTAKNAQLNTVPLVIALAFATVFTSYGLTGKWLPTLSVASTAAVAAQPLDASSLMLGVVIGSALVFVVNKKLLKRR